LEILFKIFFWKYEIGFLLLFFKIEINVDLSTDRECFKRSKTKKEGANIKSY
jgi:hypothetical protein